MASYFLLLITCVLNTTRYSDIFVLKKTLFIPLRGKVVQKKADKNFWVLSTYVSNVRNLTSLLTGFRYSFEYTGPPLTGFIISGFVVQPINALQHLLEN
jgi:hypothetical protein